MRIGVTGHRRFDDPSASSWVEARIREQLKEKAGLCGVTSLAMGADQIFARVVLELGGKLEAVLPFAGYAEGFDDEKESAGFRELIGRCTKVTTLEYNGSKDESYLNAGKYVADHSDELIAVWDGRPAAGLGGTGDVVSYARVKGITVYQINPALRLTANVH
jgi:hypothetical protein